MSWLLFCDVQKKLKFGKELILNVSIKINKRIIFIRILWLVFQNFLLNLSYNLIENGNFDLKKN